METCLPTSACLISLMAAVIQDWGSTDIIKDEGVDQPVDFVGPTLMANFAISFAINETQPSPTSRVGLKTDPTSPLNGQYADV